MSFAKKLLKTAKKYFFFFVCFIAGHRHGVLCSRCGRLSEQTTFTRRVKLLFVKRKKPMYKGSLRKKTDMIKYELDIKENKLYRLKYIIDENGRKRAKYKPTCVYFDAINDTNAIRKANKTIYSIKVGCRIDNVSENE